MIIDKSMIGKNILFRKELRSSGLIYEAKIMNICNGHVKLMFSSGMTWYSPMDINDLVLIGILEDEEGQEKVPTRILIQEGIDN